MKTVFLVSFFISASAFANIVMDCTNGNSRLRIETISGSNTVKCTLINASGVEDASGTLKCEGPMESAFGCTGAMQKLESKETLQARLVIQEQTLQGNGEGPVQFQNSTYQCEPSK